MFDSLKDTMDYSQAHNDIIDMQLGVEEEMTQSVKSTESNQRDAKHACKSETIDEALKVQQCSVFVHGNLLRVSDCKETSSPTGRIRDLTSIPCYVCGGQLIIDGGFCTMRKVHFCSICKMNS